MFDIEKFYVVCYLWKKGHLCDGILWCFNSHLKVFEPNVQTPSKKGWSLHRKLDNFFHTRLLMYCAGQHLRLVGRRLHSFAQNTFYHPQVWRLMRLCIWWRVLLRRDFPFSWTTACVFEILCWNNFPHFQRVGCQLPVGQSLYPVEQLGSAYRALRAFRPLLFLETAQVPTSSLIQVCFTCIYAPIVVWDSAAYSVQVNIKTGTWMIRTLPSYCCPLHNDNDNNDNKRLIIPSHFMWTRAGERKCTLINALSDPWHQFLGIMVVL